jgi:hypothetical protein
MQSVYDDLTSAERILFQHAALGTLADYAKGEAADLEAGASWGPARTVRAEKLRELLTGKVSEGPVHWRGVRIQGAKITGTLDLETATIPYPLELIGCWFDEPILLTDADARRIFLDGSHITALHARRLQVRGDLHLREGFTASGDVALDGASIEGHLDCSGGRFLGLPQSLSGDQISVTGDMKFGVAEIAGQQVPFTATGLISLVAANLGGDLNCDGGQLQGKGRPEATSLRLDRAHIAGNVYLGVTDEAGRAFAAAGQVRMRGTKVGGDLNCDGGQFGGTPSALRADRADVTGSVFLGASVAAGRPHRFSASGAVSLLWMRVGGDLDCRGGEFRGDATSLHADGVDVKGSLRLGAFKAADEIVVFVAAGEVSLIQAKLGVDLDCGGGEFRGQQCALHADGAAVAQSVRLGIFQPDHRVVRFIAAGEVRLIGVRVGGDLICDGGLFQAGAEGAAIPANQSLGCRGIVVGGSVCLGVAVAADQECQFLAAGTVVLDGARIEGNVTCDGGRFEGSPESLRAEGTVIGGGLSLGVAEGTSQSAHRFTAAGVVSLVDARVGGDFDCAGGEFGRDPKSKSLRADGVQVAGAAYLGVTETAGQAHAFAAAGAVSLVQAVVKGDLDCDGGRFGGLPNSTSFSAFRLQVSGNVYMGATDIDRRAYVFNAAGRVAFSGARVGGDWDCRGGQFLGNDDSSLLGDRAEVVGTIRLGVMKAGDGACTFIAARGVSLIQAKIGGELDCRGGDFRGEKSLRADGVQVARSMRLGVTELEGDKAKYRFTAAGNVRLVGANVGRDLVCDGGEFMGASSLVADDLQVAGTMDLRTAGRPNRISLRHARTRHLLDATSSWPLRDGLDVEWFTYDGFTESAPRAAKDRLNWLGLQKGVQPQPYQQLAKVFSDSGDEASASKVGVVREWRRFRRGSLGLSGGAANLLLGGTIGYGYRPGRSIYILTALYLLGALWIYPRASNVMIATKPPLSTPSLRASDACPSDYSCYSPWAYSFDALIPVVHLGQTDAWQPSGPRGNGVRRYGNIVTVLGWAFATMAVAGFTGLVRKR